MSKYKYVLFYETGYCGEEGCELLEHDTPLDDAELCEAAWQAAQDNAISFGRESDYDMESVYCHWEHYDPEKHDHLI